MMLTEEQAKEKWCPFARVDYSNALGGAAINRCKGSDGNKTGAPVAASLCIASQCMAWRWGFGEYEYAETDNEFFPGTNMFRSVTPPGDGWVNIEFESGAGRIGSSKWRRRKPDVIGYCGLAGQAKP